MAFLRKVRIRHTREFFEENILRHICFKTGKQLLLNEMKILNPNSFFILLLFGVLYPSEYPKFNLYSLYTEKVIVMMFISSSQWMKNLPSLMDCHIFQYFHDQNSAEEVQSQEMRILQHHSIKIKKKCDWTLTHSLRLLDTLFGKIKREINNAEDLRSLIP